MPERGSQVTQDQWPRFLRKHPAVVGLHHTTCVEDGTPFREDAHAHIEGAYQGWICFREARGVKETNLVRHELAHLLTREGHTKAWRMTLRALGGYIDFGRRPVPVELRGPCRIVTPKTWKGKPLPSQRYCSRHEMYHDRGGKCFAITAPHVFPWPRP